MRRAKSSAELGFNGYDGNLPPPRRATGGARSTIDQGNHGTGGPTVPGPAPARSSCDTLFPRSVLVCKAGFGEIDFALEADQHVVADLILAPQLKERFPLRGDSAKL